MLEIHLKKKLYIIINILTTPTAFSWNLKTRQPQPSVTFRPRREIIIIITIIIIIIGGKFLVPSVSANDRFHIMTMIQLYYMIHVAITLCTEWFTLSVFTSIFRLTTNLFKFWVFEFLSTLERSQGQYFQSFRFIQYKSDCPETIQTFFLKWFFLNQFECTISESKSECSNC